VHELGHFTAAKRAGIRVDEFGIGFPPRLFKKKIGETLYSINLFPLGGFVKIFGESPDEESLEGKDSSRSLVKKHKLVQAWVMAAGITFNLIFAWLILSAGFMVGMPYSVDGSAYGSKVQDTKLTIIQILPKSPAELAGLKIGDKITALAVKNKVLDAPGVKETQDFIADHAELTLSYVRGTEAKSVVVQPVNGIVGPRRVIGISLDMTGTLKLAPLEAIYAGMSTTVSLTTETIGGMFNFLKNIFVGKGDLSAISGPVGIVGVVRDASSLGFVHLVSLMALISINLAVINLLPFPALDGGRLFFLLIEAIKRSPIKPQIANIINGAGFILLIGLMVFVTYHDVLKLIHS
jgi:regulator of sigma E protease